MATPTLAKLTVLSERHTMIRALTAIFATITLASAACNNTPPPPPPPPPHPGTTYTLEPFEGGLDLTLTQLQLGGTQCPCVKIPYPTTGLAWDTQTGADRILKLIKNGTIRSGDTVMGFSLGTQTVMLFLSQHAKEVPPGIQFVLVGCTFWRNQDYLDHGNASLLGTGGVPWNIANPVTMIANEFDGYSDQPDITTAPGYSRAQQNANDGGNRVHNYANARLNHPANVVTHRGNITAILVPNQKLPINDWMRDWGNNSGADTQDAAQRAQIESAYSGPRPTAQQLSAATDEQVGIPPAPAIQTPEPVANIN